MSPETQAKLHEEVRDEIDKYLKGTISFVEVVNYINQAYTLVFNFEQDIMAYEFHALMEYHKEKA